MSESKFHTVQLKPSNKIFTVDENTLVLEAAIAAGMVVPYGCRDGVCGSCRTRVLSGLIDHAQTPLSTLSMNDRAQGYMLLCCARARSDLLIETSSTAGQEVFSSQKHLARVKKITRAAPDVMIIQLQLQTPEKFISRAGQYIEILLDNGERRAYSLANCPSLETELELHIRASPSGKFSQQAFNSLRERDILRIEGPRGSFHLRKNSSKPALLIAGGTGFAPLCALIKEQINSGAISETMMRPITLYWGAQDRAGLYCAHLPQAWAAEYADFSYVPILSAPRAEDDWQGRTGLVHKAVLEDHPDLSGFQIYVCGAPAMIEAAYADFLLAGLPQTEFFADSFTPALQKTVQS